MTFEEAIRIFKEPDRIGYVMNRSNDEDAGRYNQECEQAICMAIQALEQQSNAQNVLQSVENTLEPYEDCISRQELLDYLQFCITATENQQSHQSFGEMYVKGTIDTLERVEIKVDMMDSVTPAKMRGKWIHGHCGKDDYIKCSNCGKEIVNNIVTLEGEIPEDVFNLCPYCGSDNREVSK